MGDSKAPRPVAESQTEVDVPPAVGIKWGKSLLALVITIAVMGLLLNKVGGLDRSSSALADARWELLPLPILLLFGILFLGVIKWRIILSAMGHELPFKRATFAFLAAMPVAAITPSRAGDFLRASITSSHVPLMRGLGSVLADRLVDVQSLCLFAIVGGMIVGNHVEAILIASGLGFAWLMLVVVLKFKDRVLAMKAVSGFRDSADDLLEAIVSLLRTPRLLVSQFACSILTWGGVLVVFYLLTLIFRCELTPIQVGALWPLATLFGLLPLTLAGMGTRDAAFVFLLATHGATGVDESRVLMATLGYSLLSSWMWALLGLPLTLRWLSRAGR